jgi:hypothetical protein
MGYILGFDGKCCNSCTPANPCAYKPTIIACGSGSATEGVYGTWSAFSSGTNLSGATWSISGQPSGISIDSSTAFVYGTPATAGSFSFPVTATNACGSSSCNFALTVAENPCDFIYGNNVDYSLFNNCGSPWCFLSGCGTIPSGCTIYIRFIADANPIAAKFYLDGVLQFDTGALTSGTYRYTVSAGVGAATFCLDLYDNSSGAASFGWLVSSTYF